MERSRHLLAPRVVVFDLGEVLATAPDLFENLAALIGTSSQKVEAAYWRHRDDHDRGEAAEVFWAAVAGELGVAFSSDRVTQLSRLDSTAWTTLRPDAFILLEDLAERGVRVAILSNAPSELAELARRSSWSSAVSEWFFSGELRMSKPDPALYAHVTAALGVPAGTIAFIDDRQVNIDEAQAAGWNAHLWVSDADSRSFLRDLGQL